MRILILSLTLIAFTFAQKKEVSNNFLYGELLGKMPGVLINYEREAIPNLNLRLGMGILLGESSSNSGNHTMMGGLLIGMLNYLINFSGNNYIEADAGTATNGDSFFPAFGLGYRYCPKYGGFLFKITFDILTYKNGHTLPLGGIGFGAAF